MQLNYNYHEDCRDTMGKMEENFVHLIVTSPPYLNAKDYSFYENLDKYLGEMREIFTDAYRVLKKGRMLALNISCVIEPRVKRSTASKRIPLPFYFVNIMETIGFEFLEDIIWVKPKGAAYNRNGGFYRSRKPVAYKPNVITEYLLIFKKPAPFLIDKVLKNESLVTGEYEKTNVWEINPVRVKGHPAPFPIQIPINCIKYYSYENEIIYDPFMGSGTTAKAAKQLNRKWVGSELNKDFCALANLA